MQIQPDSYFHIYNRGAHKAPIFNESSDYQRFQKLLYIGNSTESFVLSRIKEKDFYTVDRKEPLVEVIAYCLMINHFHIVLRELKEGARTAFMRKICVGNTNYYNIKYKHSGTISQGKYKAKPINDEDYLRTVINYIHLNPYKIIEPDLSKELHADPEHIKRAIEYSKNYEYSSFKDYLGSDRPEKAILHISDICKEIDMRNPLL